MPQREVTLAGFGGQGIMTAGQLLAYAGMHEGKQVVWIPSYGPEMRGGTANCTVVVSDVRIGSPIITNPQTACVFNRPSLDKFAPLVKTGGMLLINSSLIDAVSGRDDISEYLIPANEIALRLGNTKVSNLVMLAAFVTLSSIVKFESIEKMLDDKMGAKKALLDMNHSAFDEGRKCARQFMNKVKV